MSLSRSALSIECVGETLSLLAQKAVFWAREKTLFVADVHLGKAASFRAAGLAVPSGHSTADVARLSALVEAYGAKRLIVLGDLVHNRASYTVSLDETMRAFAETHPQLKRTLVMGNHDDAAGAPPTAWGFDCLSDVLLLPPFLASHAPNVNSTPSGGTSFTLSGHIHPGIFLKTPKEKVCAPCFWVTSNCLVLPAFGSLTGRYIVSPKADELTFVVTGQQIFPVPHKNARGAFGGKNCGQIA